MLIAASSCIHAIYRKRLNCGARAIAGIHKPGLLQLPEQTVVQIQPEVLREVLPEIVRASRPRVPIQPEPFEGFKNVANVFGPRTATVQIVNPQPQHTARFARPQPREHERKRIARVQITARCGSQPGNDICVCRFQFAVKEGGLGFPKDTVFPVLRCCFWQKT